MGAIYSKISYCSLEGLTIDSVTMVPPIHDTVDYESSFCVPGKICLQIKSGENIVGWYGSNAPSNIPRGSLTDTTGKIIDLKQLHGYYINTIRECSSSQHRRCGCYFSKHDTYFIIENGFGKVYHLYVDSFSKHKQT